MKRIFLGVHTGSWDRFMEASKILLNLNTLGTEEFWEI